MSRVVHPLPPLEVLKRKRRRLASTTLPTTLENEVHTSQSTTLIEPQYLFPVITLESEPNLPDDYLPEGLSNRGKNLQPSRENSKIKKSVYTAQHIDFGEVVVKEIRYHSSGIKTEDEVERQEIIAERYKKYNERINTQLLVYNEIEHIKQKPETLAIIKKGFRTYIVQEKLNIPTIQDYVTENGPLTPAQVVRVMQSVAIPLSKVHDQGTIHRDISPGNIFINPEALNEGAIEDLAMISDFDDAVIDDLIKKDTFYTTTLGTPGFASIEVANGNTDFYGPHSDNYSLAAVAAYMLVGHNRISDFFNLKDTLLTNVPKQIRDVLEQNINSKPSERHSRVVDMVREMSGVSEAEVLAALCRNVMTGKDTSSIVVGYGVAEALAREDQPVEIKREEHPEVNLEVLDEFVDGHKQTKELSPEGEEAVDSILEELAGPIIPDFYDGYEHNLKLFKEVLGEVSKCEENPYDITDPKLIKKAVAYVGRERNYSELVFDWITKKEIHKLVHGASLHYDKYVIGGYEDRTYLENYVNNYLKERGLTPENIQLRNKHEKKLRKQTKKGLKELKKNFKKSDLGNLVAEISSCQEVIEYLDSEQNVAFPTEENMVDREKQANLFEFLYNVTARVLRKKIENRGNIWYWDGTYKMTATELTPKEVEMYSKLPLTTDTVNYLREQVGSYLEHLEEKQEKKTRLLAPPEENLETAIVKSELLSDKENEVLQRPNYSLTTEKIPASLIGAFLTTHFYSLTINSSLDLILSSLTAAFFGGATAFLISDEIFKYKRQFLDKADVMVKEYVRRTGERPEFDGECWHIAKKVAVFERKHDKVRESNENYWVKFAKIISLAPLMIYENALIYSLAQARYVAEKVKPIPMQIYNTLIGLEPTPLLKGGYSAVGSEPENMQPEKKLIKEKPKLLRKGGYTSTVSAPKDIIPPTSGSGVVYPNKFLPEPVQVNKDYKVGERYSLDNRIVQILGFDPRRHATGLHVQYVSPPNKDNELAEGEDDYLSIEKVKDLFPNASGTGVVYPLPNPIDDGKEIPSTEPATIKKSL